MKPRVKTPNSVMSPNARPRSLPGMEHLAIATDKRVLSACRASREGGGPGDRDEENDRDEKTGGER